MGIKLSELLNLRPFVYHVSCRSNFDAIKHDHALRSAENLLAGTGREHLLRERRVRSTHVIVNGSPVLIRDQLQIRPNSLRLEPNTTIQDYLDELNRRVFFWPGTARGPQRSGRGHFSVYWRQGGVFVIRLSLRSLLKANPGRDLFVAKCNSGSARHHSGRPVERGPSTFRRLNDAPLRAASVVELSFIERADLPDDAEFSVALDGLWQPL